MRPPSRRLAPGAGTARPPPLGRQGAAPGDQRAPPTPPPLPLRPKSGRRQTKETAAPHPPRRGRCTRGEGAPRPRQAPPVNRPHAPALPAADRRRTGGAQDGANGATPSEAGLGKAGARTRAGRFPPPPSPHRRTDPLAADRAAPDAHGRPATPTARVYPRGARRRQRITGQRPTGRGGGGRRSSPPTPPRSPAQLEGHRSDPLPPPNRGDAPPPPEGTATRGGGGVRLDLHTARPSAPSRLLPRGSQLTGKPTPERRRGARNKPWGRRTSAHQNSMGAAPPMTPPVTIAHSERAARGFRSEGAPGGAVHRPPLSPPPPGRPRNPDQTRTPGGSAPTRRGGPA